MRHDWAWVGINFSSMQVYIFFCHHVQFKSGGKLPPIQWTERESFLSLIHKLIRPKEKFSIITHLHWFCCCDYRQEWRWTWFHFKASFSWDVAMHH